MEDFMKRIDSSADYIKEKAPAPIDVAIVLGSGLGEFAEELEDAVALPYASIPHFPVSTVEGHAGQLVIGTLGGARVLAMQGRFHYYEGYDLADVTFPIRVFSRLGIDNLILTNAAGGVNTAFEPGDLMVITDHINLSMNNPLRGRNLDEFGPRFPDMSKVYSREFISLLKGIYSKLGLRFVSGVYSFYTGPNYETPAEIRLMRTLGTDAIGMSTVPEALVARHCGMNICGISCITNMAAGILDQPLNHQEVTETAQRVKGKFKAVIRELITQIASR